MAAGDPILDYQAASDRAEYKIGTLVYTKIGLISLFGWLLWGTVVFTLVEAIFPVSMPLQLHRLNVPDAWIAIMMTSVTQIINMAMVAPVGFRSDRTRTRWGRRIPFILGTMPLVCLSLAALGFTDDIGNLLNHAGWPARLHLGPMAVLIVVIGLMVTSFDISNVFVLSMNDYLVSDVVPRNVLGKYRATASVVGNLAAALFNFVVMRHLETHTRIIYVGAALLYLVGFLVVCFGVREGKYPPPQDFKKGQSILTSVSVYLRECFTHPYYVAMYVYSGVWAANYACNSFRTLYYTKTLGFSLEDIGHVKGILNLVSIVIAMPIGWLVDKIHPMRGLIISAALTIPFTFYNFYMPNFTWFIVIAAATLPMDILMDCSEGPLRMRIFPRAEYGQFASANSLLRSVVVFVSGLFGGFFMQHMRTLHGDRAYAYTFVWQGTFQTLGLLCLLVVFMYWKKYGDTSQEDAAVLLDEPVEEAVA